MTVTAVPKKIDRLYIVDACGALKLTGVDTDSAAGAGLDLEMVIALLCQGAVQPCVTQEDQRNLGKDVHVAREGECKEKDP